MKRKSYTEGHAEGARAQIRNNVTPLISSARRARALMRMGQLSDRPGSSSVVNGRMKGAVFRKTVKSSDARSRAHPRGRVLDAQAQANGQLGAPQSLVQRPRIEAEQRGRVGHA